MKYKVSEKYGECCFEEWSKESKEMINCGVSTNIKVGNGYICRNHLKHALSSDKKAELFGESGTPISSVVEFLDLCDGREPKERQRNLF